MRKKHQARPSPPADRKARRRKRKREPRLLRQAFHPGGMGFDDPTILAGAEAMLRHGCTYNDAALAAAAVHDHPRMTSAERAMWRKLIGSGLRAATAAQDQAFRRRLRACGERLIRAHPSIAPDVRMAWQAFALAPDATDAPPAATVATVSVAIDHHPATGGLPPVIDLVAVMTASWHRLRRMVEEDPDWFDRACTGPTGRA